MKQQNSLAGAPNLLL